MLEILGKKTLRLSELSLSNDRKESTFFTEKLAEAAAALGIWKPDTWNRHIEDHKCLGICFLSFSPQTSHKKKAPVKPKP